MYEVLFAQYRTYGNSFAIQDCKRSFSSFMQAVAFASSNEANEACDAILMYVGATTRYIKFR